MKFTKKKRKEEQKMISLYFGLPGAGKTTILTEHAIKTCKAIKKAKSPYKKVYSNISLNLPEDLKPYYVFIKCSWFGIYEISDGLVLVDEATLEFDSRDYKKFSKNYVEFFLEHRHFRVDIELFTQQWDGVDKKIRVITDNVWYIYKGIFTRPLFTRCYRVPYGIIIPDPKKDGTEKLGEIIQGYCKPHLIQRLLSPWHFRPLYYKYFDSWQRRSLPPIPT